MFRCFILVFTFSVLLLACNIQATEDATNQVGGPTETSQQTPSITLPETAPTGHPVSYCDEWREMVVLWIAQGNAYLMPDGKVDPNVPNHPNIQDWNHYSFCIRDIELPWSSLLPGQELKVGTKQGNLLPGAYEYRLPEGVPFLNYCYLLWVDDNASMRLRDAVGLILSFKEADGTVTLTDWYGEDDCQGGFYRVAD